MAAEAKVAKLVQRCIADVARHPVDHVDVHLEDDILTWHLALHFPECAPFTGGAGLALRAADFTLYVTLRFSEDFPSRPPRLKFLSPWTNHQHLWGDRICHSLLTDDFLDYFRDRRTHGTSMWSASCALADGAGLGGMPRYLQVLREYLSSDLDYAEEEHVTYDAASLAKDIEVQRSFCPEFLAWANLLESEAPQELAAAGAGGYRAPEVAVAEAAEGQQTDAWGVDFFEKSPLVPGDADSHPCFDVSLVPGRVPSLSTTMTSLCRRSFEMGARTTDFGSAIGAVLPYPCSGHAWASAGSNLAVQALEELSPISSNYRLLLPGFESEEARKLEAMLAVVGEIWKTTCIGIVKDENYESERAMMCFVTLHHLLLCLAQEHPGLQSHATATTKKFLELIESGGLQNLKACVPDLGRFLVRFLLTEGEVPLRANMATIVRELFSRNVRWIHPDDWATEGASAEDSEDQIDANFEKSQFGIKLTVFQAYYTLRSLELGLDSLEAHEALGGRPSAETLRVFQQDCRGIKDLSSFQEFFLWLQLEELAFSDIHTMLVTAVADSDARGYNEGLPWSAPA